MQTEFTCPSRRAHTCASAKRAKSAVKTSAMLISFILLFYLFSFQKVGGRRQRLLGCKVMGAGEKLFFGRDRAKLVINNKTPQRNDFLYPVSGPGPGFGTDKHFGGYKN